MDNLEKYIRDHKSSFETDSFDLKKGWAAVKKDLPNKPTKKRKSRKRWIIPLLLLTTIVIGSILGSKFINNTEQPKESEATYLALNEVNSYYSKIEQQQFKLISENASISDSEKDEIIEFMLELDKEYDRLFAEYQNNINNEKILASIISLHRLKLEKLERIQNKLNHKKRINNEKSIVL